MTQRLPLLVVLLCGCLDLSLEGKRFAGDPLPAPDASIVVPDTGSPDDAVAALPPEDAGSTGPDAGQPPPPLPIDGGQPWSDPSLTGLTIAPGGLAFAPTTTSYRVVVPRGTVQVELVASAARPDRTWLVVDGRGVAFGTPFTAALSGLTTTIDLSVIAESGAMLTYSVTVVQPGPFAVQTTLKATPPMPNADFGFTFSSSGDGNLLAVGAPGENGRGAVYVFARTGSAWAMQARLVGSNTDSGDAFGCAVALSSDGTTLAAGALGEDSDATGVNGPQNNALASGSGAAYVFTRTGAVWTQQAYLKASNTAAGDQLGFDVRLSANGNVLAAGAPQQDSSGTDSGALYVFARTGTVWAQQQYLKAPTPGADDGFGTTAALDAAGTTLAVSSPNLVGGKVFVYLRGSSWTRQVTITSPPNLAGDGFGVALAMNAAGDVLAIGAPGESSNTGTAYVYARAGSSWSQQYALHALTAVTGGLYGTSVALDAAGTTLAVGALGEDGGAGALYVHERQGASFAAPVRLTAPSPSMGAQLGAWWLALSSDALTLFGGAYGDASEAGAMHVWTRALP